MQRGLTMALTSGKTVYVIWDQEEFTDGNDSCLINSSYSFCGVDSDCNNGEICQGGLFCVQPAPCRYEVRFFAYGGEFRRLGRGLHRIL